MVIGSYRFESLECHGSGVDVIGRCLSASTHDLGLIFPVSNHAFTHSRKWKFPISLSETGKSYWDFQGPWPSKAIVLTILHMGALRLCAKCVTDGWALTGDRSVRQILRRGAITCPTFSSLAIWVHAQMILSNYTRLISKAYEQSQGTLMVVLPIRCRSKWRQASVHIHNPSNIC